VSRHGRLVALTLAGYVLALVLSGCCLIGRETTGDFCPLVYQIGVNQERPGLAWVKK
jgi:hypothetical protein